MTDRPKSPEVDRFLSKAEKWREAFEALRAMILDRRLTETLKWGVPCYTFEGRNIVLMHGFKDYCALLFFKGALLKDSAGVLVQQTENVQAGRHIRFAGVQDVVALRAVIKSCLDEAIELEKAGAKVPFKTTKAFAVPEEFQTRLDRAPDLKAAFEALTPGRQRAYLLHFSSAKQARTRESRIEKHLPRILDGKGLDD